MISKLFKRTISIPILLKYGLKNAPYRSFVTKKMMGIIKGRQKLLKALSNEIEYEKEQYKKDKNIKSFLELNNWILKDEEDSNHLELRKQINDTTVTVNFQSRSLKIDDEEEFDEEKFGLMKQEEANNFFNDKIKQDSFNFTVYLENQFGGVLVYECTSFDTGVYYSFSPYISISHVICIWNLYKYKELTKIQKDALLTGRPEFSSLDKTLQRALAEYLQSFGINEEFAVFLEEISFDKEQRLYIRWLQDLDQFVAEI